MNVTPGEQLKGFDLGAGIIGHVKEVRTHGECVIELNELGRRLYGPFVELVLAPSRGPQAADEPHIVEAKPT